MPRIGLWHGPCVTLIRTGMVPAQEINPMLKTLLVLVCLVAGVSAMTGCHADAKTDHGHGVSADVG